MQLVMDMNKNKKVLSGFIAISLLIHLSMSFVYLNEIKFFDQTAANKPEAQKLLLKLVNAEKAKQIVQTVESNKRKPVDKSFLSKADNVADRQTKTKNIGKFALANKGVRNATKKIRKKSEDKSLSKKLKKIKLSDLSVKSHEKLAVKKKKKKEKKSSQVLGLKAGRKSGKALGASSDFLEDIPLGDFTKLNTQEYEFYGFYHRIREKLEQFWGNNIQTEAEKIFKQGRSIASESNLITGLTIKINSVGEIVDITLKSTSGIKELDDAAVKSFNQAGPFPNPPKNMIKSDGKATIEWGFVVNT